MPVLGNHQMEPMSSDLGYESYLSRFRFPENGVPHPVGPTTWSLRMGNVAFLARELKTPVINETFAVLGDQARTEGWSHEEYLAAALGRQVASRTANGTRMRIAAAHFPAVKTIEDFSFDHIPATTRDLIAHLATTTFVAKRDNVVLLGPPGTGKTHLAIALAIKAPRPPTRSRSTPRPAGSPAWPPPTSGACSNVSCASSTATGCS